MENLARPPIFSSSISGVPPARRNLSIASALAFSAASFVACSDAVLINSLDLGLSAVFRTKASICPSVIPFCAASWRALDSKPIFALLAACMRMSASAASSRELSITSRTVVDIRDPARPSLRPVSAPSSFPATLLATSLTFLPFVRPALAAAKPPLPTALVPNDK